MGSLIATSILENFTKIIFEINFPRTYGYLPWTRFIVLPLEIYLILKYLKEIDNNQGIFNYNKILQLSILTIILIICTPFRYELEPSYIVCGNVFFNKYEFNQHRLNMETHSQQEYITGLIEKVMYGFFILFIVLKNFDNQLNKNRL